MSGHLGLGTPWARQAIPQPLRGELQGLIPEGWTVGLAVLREPRDRRPGRYRAWINDDVLDRYAVYMVEGTNPEWVIRKAIDYTLAAQGLALDA
jgi:hypothetical protein